MASNQSAFQKAAEARKAAADFKAKQRAAARRNTILASLGALALVVVFAVIVMLVINIRQESDPDLVDDYTVYDSGELQAPSVVDETEAILVGPGGVVGGTVPADAIRIDLVEDPICPWCAIFDEIASQEVEALVDQGEVAFYFHIISFLDAQSVGTHYSTRMAGAWLTVAEYDPEHFWAFVKTSYANAPEEGTKGLTNGEIADLARGAGVSEEAIAKFKDGVFTLWLEASTDRTITAYSDVDGRFGTPSVLIGGVRFGYWTTPGNITAGVAYVRDFGAAAFEEYLATPQESEPSS